MQSVSIMEHPQTPMYRHKKFDMSRDVEKIALHIKKELISRSNTPCSTYGRAGSRSASGEDDLSSSFCSSDQEAKYMPSPKRRRLASVSSNASLASHNSPIRFSVDAIKDICKYHKNMVRNFPKKERTPKDQERRNKNTIACRMSRRKKKIDDLHVEVQYKKFLQNHHEIAEQSLRAKVYLDQLTLMVRQVEQCQPPPRIIREENVRSNFSIDYLIGPSRREQV